MDNAKDRCAYGQYTYKDRSSQTPSVNFSPALYHKKCKVNQGPSPLPLAAHSQVQSCHMTPKGALGVRNPRGIGTPRLLALQCLFPSAMPTWLPQALAWLLARHESSRIAAHPMAHQRTWWHRSQMLRPVELPAPCWSRRGTGPKGMCKA